MSKIKVTVGKKYGQYLKYDEYVYPFSEYEAVCGYIKKIMVGGNFDSITIERKDK